MATSTRLSLPTWATERRISKIGSAPPQIADVNGDCILDILLPADGSIGIALGNGDGTLQTQFAVGAGPGLGQVFMQNLHGQSPKAGLPDPAAPDTSGG